MPHQYFGIESSLFSSAVFSEGESSNQRPSQIGQPNSNSILEPHGRSIIDPPMLTCNSDIGLAPCSADNNQGRISPRGSKHNSRLGISSPPGQQQLAVVTSSVRCIEPSVRSFLYWPICIQNQLSVANILQLEARPRGIGNRCLFSVMGQDFAISFPTFLFDWESPSKDPERISGLGLPYCTSLACSDMNQDLLSSPDQRPHPLLIEGRLFLTAWPISGRDMKCKAFCKELQNSSSNLGEVVQTQHIARPGISGIAGVLDEVMIPLQHLWITLCSF